MKRERRERIKTHVSMKERVVSKIVKKWLYKYYLIISSRIISFEEIPCRAVLPLPIQRLWHYSYFYLSSVRIWY